MLIKNRRYIGCKTELLEYINNTVEKYKLNDDFTFFDPFSGTGVVANYFYEKGHKVIVNDILKSNYVCYRTWISNDEYDIEKIEKEINKFNKIDVKKINSNYFSEKFGNKYYSVNDAKKIGYIREEIEKNKLNYTEREYYILLTSLMYEADKIANTCGHFESFLNRIPEEKGICLRIPDIRNTNIKSDIYCMDANLLAKKVEADITYIDPPYNARQYVNFYHVLENLIRWEKPEELEGNSMKFKRNHLKSDYSKAKAPAVFEDLINSLKTKIIIVSYNNTYNARSGASNNKISEKQIMDILSKKGKTERIEINHKFFNAGKTNFDNHKEYLYVCMVKEV